MSARASAASRERLLELQSLGVIADPAPWIAKLEAAPAISRPTRLTVVHGDLHFRHLLVDGQAALCGIIDWGEVCLNDPAVDLPLYWSFLPTTARALFLNAYGPVTNEQLAMARVLAIFLCAALAAWGRRCESPGVLREAMRGLELALQD